MTKIEEVARASFACWRKRMNDLGYHLDKGQTFEDMSGSEREFALMNARAMIAAMREPTKKMLKAAENEQSPSYEYNENGMTIDIWRAMIDAALKE